MKSALSTNALILVCIALLGYALTLYFDYQKPHIIIQPEAPAIEMTGSETAPDFSIATPDGQEYSLQQFRGKIVLLNFWASWCPPCVKEFPHFIEIAEKYKDDVVFIALSSDIDEQSMLDFAQKLEQARDISLDQENIVIALDTKSITQQTFSSYLLPETLIIDQNGIMREKLVGADWTIEYLGKRIEKLKSEQ